MNISPLPFYSNPKMQNHYKDYAFGQIYPLITYKDSLLPFQIIVPAATTTISSPALVNHNTGDVISLNISTLISAGLEIKPYDMFAIIRYPAKVGLGIDLKEGQYYLRMRVVGVGVIYSDIFTVVNDVSDYLLLEYTNSYNLNIKGGIVDFSDGFTFRCYLNTQVGKPEYSFEEEATERMGYSFVESQVSKKIYKFTFLAPEYLCDALRIVRLCDTKTITSKLKTYDLTAFSMDPSWEEQGDLAAVECEFETDTVIASIANYASTSAVSGDFNNDYNNDYDIEKS